MPNSNPRYRFFHQSMQDSDKCFPVTIFTFKGNNAVLMVLVGNIFDFLFYFIFIFAFLLLNVT